MSTDQSNETDSSNGQEHGEDAQSRFAAGDDERENREQIAKTGEPQRDELGNTEGAS